MEVDPGGKRPRGPGRPRKADPGAPDPRSSLSLYAHCRPGGCQHRECPWCSKSKWERCKRDPDRCEGCKRDEARKQQEDEGAGGGLEQSRGSSAGGLGASAFAESAVSAASSNPRPPKKTREAEESQGGWDAVEVKVVRSSRNGVAKPLLGGVEEGSNDTFAVWVAAPNEALTPAQAPCGNDHQPYATRWLRDGSPSPLSMSPTQHRLHASQGLHAAPLRSMQRSACSQSMELSDTSPAACIRAQTQTWGSARD